MFKLVFSEQREHVLSMLRNVFSSDETVEISSEQPNTFVVRQDLDALIVTRWTASDRYGANIPVGVSQVVSTKGDRYAPSYVVTTPGFAAHIELDNAGHVSVVRNTLLPTVEQESFVVFSKIFQAIEKFNTTNEPGIGVLGCNLEYIRSPLAHDEEGMAAEVWSIYRAYSTFREK